MENATLAEIMVRILNIEENIRHLENHIIMLELYKLELLKIIFTELR